MPDTSGISAWTNLLPGYQSPQAMAASAASTANTQANTGLLGAQTGLIGQQTQAADIANQGNALKLGLLQNYLQGTSPTNGAGTAQPAAGGLPATGAPAPGSGGTIGGTNYSPDDVTTGIIRQFAPLPTARPPAVTAQMAQATLAGLPEVAASIGARYDAQVQGANQQRQLGANAAYQMQQMIASAPSESAWETFDRYEPQQAALFKAQHPSDDHAQLDADVRLMAQHVGIAVHQYTGRDTDFQNGVLVDKQDGEPVLGSQQVLTGLDAAGKEKAFGAANELVTVNNSDGSTSQVPRYQQAGFNNAEGYVIAADKAARSSANSPANDVPAASGSTPATQGNTSATVPPPKANAAPAAPAAVTTDPVLKTALADPDYKLKTPPVVSGRTPTPAELDQQKATVQARTDLLKDSQEATSTAAQSLMYTKAAQALMASGGNVTGLGAENRILISRVAQSVGLTSGVNATNYQELAKYMGNAALQGAKQTYGSKMTESEVKMQMEELSPDVTKTPDAINHLLDNNAKNLQYTIDTARRTRPYLATGGDPQSFADWNQKYYPRERVVGPPAAARPGQQSGGASGMPAAGTVRGGYKFTGGDPSNKANWVKQ